MNVGAFLQSLVMGFSIAAPVGPIGVLRIRRILAAGRAARLAAGLGAATADAIYGGIAAFGLTALSDAVTSWQAALRLIGGAFLCILGDPHVRGRAGRALGGPCGPRSPRCVQPPRSP